MRHCILFYSFSAQECNKSSTVGHKIVQRVFTSLAFAFIFLAPVMSKTTLTQWLKTKEKTHLMRKVQVLITPNTVRVVHAFSAYDKTIHMSC